MITKHAVILPVLCLFLLSPAHLSPPDFCVLTPSTGFTGSIKFVEDCKNLDIFPTLPIPGPPSQKFGTHPVVCCPKIYNKTNCLPTDPWCPSYVPPTNPAPVNDYHDYYDYEIVTDPPIVIHNNVPKVSDEDCSGYVPFWGNETSCVNFKDCPAIFGPPLNPTKNPNYAGLCGWDHEDKAAKVCCPGPSIQDKNLRAEVEPRFPGYNCEDKVSKCQQWKDNHGCRTDMDFLIDPEDPDKGRTNSRTMFEFMTGACMDTCQLCGDKGCRDEHPDCPDWARQGYCVTNSDLMVHTCRESCGVCGFLSTDDNGIQEVEGNTYTDFRDSNFDCGRYTKQLTLLKVDEEKDDTLEEEDDSDIRRRMKRVSGSLEKNENINAIVSALSIVIPSPKFDTTTPGLSANFGVADSGTKFCGATLVTDKWIVTAAHCLDADVNIAGQPRQVKLNTIRDNTAFTEIIEIKRKYVHPNYVYPNLYNNIALLELGRRVEYNWEKYGDSPLCIDRVGENVGKHATIQGYGTTENGTLGDLLETYVTVISHDECKATLTYNTTGKPTIRAKINHGLPNGLTDDMFCAQGTEKEPGVIRGACAGDSGGGGPLFVRGEDGRQMLVGIVSGGTGCGQGYPTWYTKVSSFVPWIECIIDNSVIYKNDKEKIEEECGKVAEQAEEEYPEDYTFSENLYGEDNNEDIFDSEYFDVEYGEYEYDI